MLDYSAAVLHEVAENVWTCQGVLDAPGMRLPVRTTIVRLADRALLVYGPFELDDALAAAIDAIGDVTWLVGPNAFHHLRLQRWQERWPNATMLAAPALHKKRKALPFAAPLGETSPPAWAGAIDCVVLGGAPKIDEVVLFHRASGSLLCGDLVFNVEQPRGLFLGLFMRLTGTHRRFAMSRVWKLSTKDRARMKADAETILGFDIRRVIMAHGEVVEDDARARLAEALAWMRDGARDLPAPAAAR